MLRELASAEKKNGETWVVEALVDAGRYYEKKRFRESYLTHICN